MGMGVMKSSSPWLLISVVLIGSISFCTSTSLVNDNNNKAASFDHCNASTIGECIIAEEEEFMMDSEVNRRLLADGQKSITYDVLKTKPFCNAQIYGNCIKVGSQEAVRACNLYHRCERNYH